MATVSAIITTYKREPERVERALKSVLSQTYPLEKIIIVDDSPSSYELRDAVKEMALNYAGQNVIYIAHQENKGACAARNTGALHTDSEFIAFLDDDDEWLPEKTEKQMAVFSDGVGLVYCGYTALYEDKNEYVTIDTIYKKGDIYLDLIEKNFVGSTSFTIIRKEAFSAVGGFDELLESAQDLDMWIRIAEKYKVDYVKEPLVIYHCHSGDQISKNPQRKINGLERLNLKNAKVLNENRYLRWLCNIRIIPHYAAAKQKKKAFNVWLKCIFTCPLRLRDNIKYLLCILK